MGGTSRALGGWVTGSGWCVLGSRNWRWIHCLSLISISSIGFWWIGWIVCQPFGWMKSLHLLFCYHSIWLWCFCTQRHRRIRVWLSILLWCRIWFGLFIPLIQWTIVSCQGQVYCIATNVCASCAMLEGGTCEVAKALPLVICLQARPIWRGLLAVCLTHNMGSHQSAEEDTRFLAMDNHPLNHMLVNTLLYNSHRRQAKPTCSRKLTPNASTLFFNTHILHLTHSHSTA